MPYTESIVEYCNNKIEKKRDHSPRPPESMLNAQMSINELKKSSNKIEL